MKQQTKVLLKEMINSYDNENWNAIVLIYRPLLTHLVSDILKLSPQIIGELDYSEIIKIMEQSGIISDSLLLSQTFKMKSLANKINHQQYVVEEAEGKLAAEIIKIIINTNS